MEILHDKYGKPQGIIREIAGGQERLYDRAGHAIDAASHRTTDCRQARDANKNCLRWRGLTATEPSARRTCMIHRAPSRPCLWSLTNWSSQSIKSLRRTRFIFE